MRHTTLLALALSLISTTAIAQYTIRNNPTATAAVPNQPPLPPQVEGDYDHPTGYAHKPWGPAPAGNWGVGHTELHPYYKNLFNDTLNMPCCHDQDCRPTQAREHDGSWEILINGVWAKVKTEWIVHKSAPDGGAHVCAGTASAMDPLGRVYCVVLPPQI